MAFYPTPFGHVEVHVDRRDPRPARLVEELPNQGRIVVKRRRSR